MTLSSVNIQYSIYALRYPMSSVRDFDIDAGNLCHSKSTQINGATLLSQRQLKRRNRCSQESRCSRTSSGVVRESSWWASPFAPHFPFLLPPPLRSRPHIAAKRSGGALKLPSRAGRSPAAKRFLVHFKHYVHRERIEKQISKSSSRVLIYNISSGVTPIGQGWTNARGLRCLGALKPDPKFALYPFLCIYSN